MSLLVLDALKKHYGAQEVLSGASLTIDPGAKIGIVGRNGGGKTTLMRMIAGKEHPDWGSVTLRKGARLGSVPQRPVFEAGVTAREYVAGGLDEARRVLTELEVVGERMGEASGDELERLMREHDRLTERVEHLGGWDAERSVETVMSGIGLAPALWDREARVMSGGEKSRTALARELVAGHDLLLLDEPTNHLDLEGIEWIERWIAELDGAVLIVSHDRRLLTNSVQAILELERGQLTSYAGSYPKYLVQKAERYDSDHRAWAQQHEMVKREELFIKKHMGSQRTAEAKGRAKKLSNIVRLEQPFLDVRRPVIRTPKAARGGELVLTTEGLSGGYESNVLFKDVDLRIGRGQRIGVVGPNGAGKTTLLKILAGRMQPLAGKVLGGHGSICGYHDQDTAQFHPESTPFLEISRSRPGMTDLEVRSHLARFLFRGNEVDKEIAALSGGERARVALALLVLDQPSWMALDEPTNHLDLASRASLEEMLSEFDGALLCVSHDREFLDGLCTHVISVSGGQVREHDGNYSSWRRLLDEERTEAGEAKAKIAGRKKAEERRQREAATKKSGKKPAQKAKRPRNPYRLDKLEKEIMRLEERLAELQAACATEDVYRNPQRLKETQIEIAEVEHELALANEEWESFA